MAGANNFFDRLLEQLHLSQILTDPHATGAGVKVGVIDSGIEQSVIREKHPQSLPITGVIYRPESVKPLAYDGHQSGPHGTVVADIILTLAPQVQLYSVDVFGPSGGSDVETVIRAVRHCLDEGKCHMINLSLGVPESKLIPNQRQQFFRVIEEAYNRDVLVIAAAANDHPLTKSYPAVYSPPLISVNKGIFSDPLEFIYQHDHAIEFQAHSRGYLGLFTREPATSWAAPHLTGICARILSLQPNLKPFEMKTLLYWLSKTRRS